MYEYEQELELDYRKRANRTVLLCVVIFCISRIIAELLTDGSQLQDVAKIAIGTCIAVCGLLLLQKTNLKSLPFIIPFSLYIIYLIFSYAIDSYKYLYSVYLIALIIGVAYFSIKNYLIFIAITQVINLLLSIFILDGHASISGSVWMHFALIFIGSLMLFIVLYYAVSKSNEIDKAFTSFGALMKVTPNVFILIDENNKIKYLSQSVTKVLNIKEPKKFIEKNFLELFEGDSVKELLKDIAKKRSFYENYQKITVNEHVKTFNVFADKMSNDETSGMFFMFNDVSEIIRLKELAEQDSLMDSLIHIPNRRAFDKQISQEWNMALRDKVNLSFLMIDIDFFKKYNDTYGHSQGDELLKTAGEIFKRCLKRSTDFVARLGGEEFGVLLHATNSFQANVIAERIREAVENEVITTRSGEQTKFTISIGICTLIPYIGLEYGFIIEEADKALYKAKENGRNQVQVAAWENNL